MDGKRKTFLNEMFSNNESIKVDDVQKLGHLAKKLLKKRMVCLQNDISIRIINK